MPIYEYRCTECGRHSEVLQKINDAPLLVCEKCEKNTLERLISLSSFRLNGSGWYKTDYSTTKNTETNTVASSISDNKNKLSEPSSTATAQDK